MQFKYINTRCCYTTSPLVSGNLVASVSISFGLRMKGNAASSHVQKMIQASHVVMICEIPPMQRCQWGKMVVFLHF